MRFAFMLAWRHLINGKAQTALTVGAVAIAVIVVVFFQSVMNAVIQLTLDDAIGSQAHITVKPPEQRPRLLSEIQTTSPPTPFLKERGATTSQKDASVLASAIDKQISQRKDLEDWRRLELQLNQFDGVRLLASTVRGNAFVIRGAKRQGAEVIGGDPVAIERIYRLQKYLVAGRWLDLGPESVVMGWRLADECGIMLGDRIRIESSQGVVGSYLVAGLFDAGIDGLDRGRVYMTLSAAQSLFAMQQNVSAVDVKLSDPFQANQTADTIARVLPYKVDSWQREQPQVGSAISTQTTVRDLISSFALISSAFAIASVLIVSVIQRGKQIGILKSIGAKDRQILLVFTLEGLIIALAGCLIGSLLVYGMLSGFASVKVAGRFGQLTPVLPVVIDGRVFLTACLAATGSTLLAAILPARRAAQLDPVEAIRS